MKELRQYIDEGFLGLGRKKVDQKKINDLMNFLIGCGKKYPWRNNLALNKKKDIEIKGNEVTLYGAVLLDDESIERYTREFSEYTVKYTVAIVFDKLTRTDKMPQWLYEVEATDVQFIEPEVKTFENWYFKIAEFGSFCIEPKTDSLPMTKNFKIENLGAGVNLNIGAMDQDDPKMYGYNLDSGFFDGLNFSGKPFQEIAMSAVFIGSEYKKIPGYIGAGKGYLWSLQKVVDKWLFSRKWFEKLHKSKFLSIYIVHKDEDGEEIIDVMNNLTTSWFSDHAKFLREKPAKKLK